MNLTIYYRIRPNGPPTTAETIRIKRFISSRRRDIENITLALNEEEIQIDECKKAISNLEISIPQGKKALQAHEENLVALITIQSRLQGLSSAENVTLEPEDHSRGLYHEMKNSADALLNESLNSIDKQVDHLQKEVRNLQDKVKTLDLELEGWKISHGLSIMTFQHLMESREKMEEDMKEAQNLLRPMPRVPSEIWVDIFGRCVQLEMEEYVSGKSTTPLRSAAFVISQVCRGWRNLVLQEKGVWDVVATHPNLYWSRDKCHFFTTLVSRSSPRVTLVANLSQTLSWRREQTPHDGYIYFDNQGTRIDGITLDGKSEVTGKRYTTHVVIKKPDPQLAQRMQSIPFRHADSLVLSSLVPGYNTIFSRQIDFTSIISFTINQECPSIAAWPGFSERFPNLEILQFHVHEFLYSLPIRSFLVSGLKELHLRHKSSKKLPSLSENVQLPNLRTLGISFPGSEYLAKFEAPLLSTLLFYGSFEPATLSLTTNDDEDNTVINNLLKQLTHLQFKEWAVSLGGAEAVACLRELWTKMNRLKRLTFSDSYVNGETLILTIDPSRLPADDQSSFSSLASITLNRTTGITQADCEILCGMEKTVKVYV